MGWKSESSLSEGLCNPEKGDFGEIMAALYLLFCADEERKSLNENYTSFAVPLGRWAERLASGGRLADGKAKTPATQVLISAI